ncbi:hypothetical protein HFN65_31530 [Rhizobium laguerreae]|uniref:hypothetical protein n=1 Tax=Rhizobium laguerreae TaxID=1076926 RepID=UPI001C924280|nr:hypothetical protein [Rhizobium laguerreae]MBY3575472.1 hypothetical protein [Rhizobium laguerreae]
MQQRKSTSSKIAAPPKKNWRTEKERLSSAYGWLKDFKDSQSVDELVFKFTNSISKEPLTYDPYQIEALLSSVSTLLDRCLVYRRELFDLEEQAVKRALEYDLFRQQLDAQKNIELATHVESQRQKEKSGQDNAAKAFAEIGAGDLGKGFSLISEASSQSSGIAIGGEQDRKRHVEAKWTALADYQQTLQARHETPGHALNYTERANRIRSYLEQDISIAYRKSRSIDYGQERIFNIVERLKPPKRERYLDYLVSYIREAINKIELKAMDEIEFEHVVSIHQPRAKNPGGKAKFEHMDDENWKMALNAKEGDGEIGCDLQIEFPSTIKRLRVRGISASMLVESPDDPVARQRTCAIVVFPPRPSEWPTEIEEHLKDRTPVIIEHIGPADQRPAPTRYVSINNLDPRGSWRIQVSTNLLWADGKVHGRSETHIKDIKLHFNLLATVASPDDTAWKEFWF